MEKLKKVDIVFEEAVENGETVIKAKPIKTTTSKTKFDLLETEISNIPPKKIIKVIFSFIQVLENTMNKKYRLCIPFVLTPRYTPAQKIYDLLNEMIYIQKIRYDYKDLNMLSKANKETLEIMKNNSEIRFIKKEGSDNLYYTYDVNLNLFSSRETQNIYSPTKNFILNKKNLKYYQIKLDNAQLNIPDENLVIEYEIKKVELL